ncbi:MAG: HAD family hydrolase [candidate division WOR-3 bacterium]|nr:HAD family hydrolase [candidate division WOR-3 bacterium]
MRIILFDIDGTLLKAGGIVREAMGDALEEVFDTRGGIADVSFIGATDLGVVHELMNHEGFSREEINLRFPKLIQTYGSILREKLSSWNNFKLCPGVPEILDELKARGTLLGLVTGNCQVGAAVKLDRGRLTGYFRFGAFGDETTDRARMCEFAHKRGEAQAAEKIPKASVILVGDSPNDITAARAYGIRMLAVSSGWIGAEELSNYNPDWLYPDLASTQEIVDLLLG